MKKIKYFAWGVAGIVGMAVTIAPSLYSPVRGSSMEPAIHDGDAVLVDYRPLLRFGDPHIERGDMVTFNPPIKIGEYVSYLKRVDRMPGETVGGFRGVGGTLLRDGEYWMLGDNTEDSVDSREFGPVKEEKITGKVTRVDCPHESERKP